ncbi:hypothetical protein GJ744_008610 [Endocarpon pusillum]|uniref:5'-hydroxyaverantin dehydrogenase n=1 Tax=Endocarpon pusillum TaxID=364733 RepID=A0A8H7E6Q8_9EURO|nr:hypothetical protein GJ744_008610 [Endocarpon pusillum]
MASPAIIPLDAIQSAPIDLTTSFDSSQISGSTILITGGASGLGAAFAHHWASLGANIIIGDVNQPLSERLIAGLRSQTSNSNHHFIPLDVTSWTSQLSFFEEAVRLSPTGGIDCVVANAGINLAEESLTFEKPPDYHGQLVTTSQGKKLAPPAPPQFKTVDVNLTGVLYSSHLAHAYLPLNPGSTKCNPNPHPGPATSFKSEAANKDRHLLLIASIAGLWPLPNQTLYSVSKHAVVGLFRSLRVTSPVRHGIRVNMLCPYFTATPILGTAGKVMLSGAALTEMRDVVAAATRLVADRTVVGRGWLSARGGGGRRISGRFRWGGRERRLGGICA